MSTSKLWIIAGILGLISAIVIVTVVNTKEQIIVEVPISNTDEPSVEKEIINSPLEISEGFYAISIELGSDYRGVSGFILPGGIIDVYEYEVKEEKTTKEISVEYELMLNKVKVLASEYHTKEIYDQEEVPKYLTYATITIEVKQEDIDKILDSQGKYYYAVLHNYQFEKERKDED